MLIEITNEQYKLLKFLQNERLTQDNDCIDEPIWSVQNEIHKLVNENYQDGDNIEISYEEDKLIIKDYCRKKFHEIKKEVEDWSNDLELLDFSKEIDYLAWEDISCYLEMRDWLEKNDGIYCALTEENDFEDIAYFLTKKEAKDYIEYQGHNLKKPRTYAYGLGYGNKSNFKSLLKFLKEVNLGDLK